MPRPLRRFRLLGLCLFWRRHGRFLGVIKSLVRILATVSVEVIRVPKPLNKIVASLSVVHRPTFGM
jgi:hypothetical protein